MDRRFLALSAEFASLVRGKADGIRKPPFYPLNYGNKFKGPDPDFNVSDDSSKLLRRRLQISATRQLWQGTSFSCKEVADQVRDFLRMSLAEFAEFRGTTGVPGASRETR